MLRGRVTAVRWDRVDAMIDASPGLEDLRAHGLHLLAAQRWRSTGAPVPAGLVGEELLATWRTHAVRPVLERVRAVCRGPLMLVKGPTVAARYPSAAARPFIDLDLLVPDARAVQSELMGQGFRLSCDPADYPDDLHHLPPIHWPERPISIEVHSRLKWVEGLNPPTFEVLAAAAGPAALDIDGILVPSPAHHTLVLAAHLWAHDPLTRLLRILDVALMAEQSDPREIASLARAWRMGRLWRSTAAVADALFGGGRGDPWPLRTWARGLRSAREASVSELHLSRLLSPLAIHTPLAAVRALGAAVAGFARPHDSEPWRRKVTRTAQQIAHPTMRRSDHVKALEPDGPAKH